MNKKFKCSCCGACCKLVGCSIIPEIKAMAKENTDECRHLLPNNKCAIYDSRPIFCRVDDYYDQYIKDKSGITREQWYEDNHKHCKLLRNMLNIKEPIENDDQMNKPDKIYMPNELLSEEWQRHIENLDTEYIRKDAILDILKQEKENVGIGLNAYAAGEENGKCELINKLIQQIQML